MIYQILKIKDNNKVRLDKNKISLGRNLSFITLFLIAFLGRTAYHIAPNVEFVTFALVLVGYYLGTKQSLWLIMSVMVLSDLVLGNTNIFLFTWTGFLIPALVLYQINKLTNHSLTLIKSDYLRKAFSLTLSGLVINLFFFIWTNFGVWMLDSWGMYTKDLHGLIASYINALPFLRNQITSTVISIPAGYLIIEYFKHLHLHHNRRLSKKFPGLIS